MSIACAALIKVIESLAPLQLAEAWDNSGWQLGDYRSVVKRVLLALDVNKQVLEEAKNNQCNLILCHHPLFFKGIKNIHLDQPQGELVAELIKSEIAVYAAHTSLDSAPKGVNYILAQKLGLQDVQVMLPGGMEKYLKLVVFIPVGYEEIVRAAICQAGAGWIGGYSQTSFSTAGNGTFQPEAGTRPFIGTEGQLERVEEIRLETIVPVKVVDQVVEQMLQVHPYEEVAYDLYPLENQGEVYGMGRIGRLAVPVKFVDLVRQVKEMTGISTIKAGGTGDRIVTKVAVCGGAGAELWTRATGADVFVTGDIKYHTALDMLTAGLNFIDAGHYATEQIALPVFRQYLLEALGRQGINLEIILAQSQSDPFIYY